MASRLYVGNLPYNFTSQDLQQLFGAHGGVRSAEVIMDRMTGRSRGFGFVEMESDSASQAAIAALHEKDVAGRKMTVNEARERTPRGPGGPRPGGGGGGGYGGGGFGGGGPRPGGGGGGGEGRPGFSRGGSGGSERRDRGDRGDRYSDGGGGGGRSRRRDDDM
jgi:RNA recognition motif-containing protein